MINYYQKSKKENSSKNHNNVLFRGSSCFPMSPFKFDENVLEESKEAIKENSLVIDSRD